MEDLDALNATPKWTEEDMQRARDISHTFGELAMIEGPRYSNRWFATNQLYNLSLLLEDGLPHCYPTIDDYWYDFWPNFSWDDKEIRGQVRTVLGDSRYPDIRLQFKAKFDVDLDQVLGSALVDES